MSDFEALLREHRGLHGLARELGQQDPNAWLYEPAANDDEPPKRALWWRCVLEFLLRRSA